MLKKNLIYNKKTIVLTKLHTNSNIKITYLNKQFSNQIKMGCNCSWLDGDQGSLEILI